MASVLVLERSVTDAVDDISIQISGRTSYASEQFVTGVLL